MVFLMMAHFQPHYPPWLMSNTLFFYDNMYTANVKQTIVCVPKDADASLETEVAILRISVGPFEPNDTGHQNL